MFSAWHVFSHNCYTKSLINTACGQTAIKANELSLTASFKEFTQVIIIPTWKENAWEPLGENWLNVNVFFLAVWCKSPKLSDLYEFVRA